ncbi:hypothetical protein BJY00DRAFT_318785 [Aspergillus carlsbadensis]|nr:hypothetical protein BJY00DRAFT_318785 [Aspergillus carlsbadensis]
MHVFSTLLSLALLVAVGNAATGKRDVGRASRKEFTTVAAPIAVITDGAGVQRELVEPSLTEEDLIAEDEDFYYYADIADIFNGGKPKPKDKCPKKCGQGEHCCPRHFCQASAGKKGRCLGGN